MENHKYIDKLIKRFITVAISILLFYWPSEVSAQQPQQVALPSDGSFSAENSPQGGLRYQRQLYLITPEEMTASGISTGTDFNSIGFTIATAQSDTTKAGFFLYLQNTTDTESRVDLTWSDSTSTTNSLLINNLFPGDYEWQIQAVCSGSNSTFTDLKDFSTASLFGCNQPINLSANTITESSATLQWDAPDSPGFSQYKVEYKAVDEVNWTTVTPNPVSQSVGISGLVSSTIYQWQIRTFCAADSSQLSGSNFTTLNVDNCNEPSNLLATALADTTASLTWDAAADAINYDVRFRRVGSSVWLPAFSFSNSLTLSFGLDPGTTYEWQVRADCSAGGGAFTPGNNFQTAGDVQCYFPTDLFVNNLSATTATLHWTPVVGATSYNIRYRLKNAISWTNAITPMTAVPVENDSIIVPDTIGAFVIPFSTGTTFNYTGDGLYVAFQYSRSTGVLPSLNNALATQKNAVIIDQSGIEIPVILCLDGPNDANDIQLPENLTAAQLRPQTTFGSASFVDSVAIEAVYALGHYSTSFSGNNEVTALVTNFADEERTYTVQFNVTGAEIFSAAQSITIPAEDSALLSFTGWLPSIEGMDTISISVNGLPSENVLSNNEAFYYTKVNASIHAFDDNSAKANATGFGTGEGLILARYNMNGCGAVNAAQVYIDFSAEGDTLYAVLMDAAGTLIDSSDILVPTTDQLNTYHSFYFSETVSFVDENYYIGLAQIANPMKAYFPVGVQWETAFVRDSAYYRANIDGTGLTHHPLPGRLMIRAEIVAGGETAVINGDLSLCSGDMETLMVASANTRFGTKVLEVSSEFGDPNYGASQALGTPNIYPGYGSNTGQWISDTPDDNPREYIVMKFPSPAPVNFIDIYETLNPGAIDTVYVKDPGTGNFVMVYSNTASPGQAVGTKNHITFPLTSFNVSEIRIAMASDSVMGFNGIDAVGIGEETPAAFTSYSWSTGSTEPSISVNLAGTYSVTVVDSGGCTSATSVLVISPEEVMPVVTVLGGASTTFCAGENITLSASESTNISWSTGETTPNIVVSTSGSYTVDFEDGTGCGINTSDPIIISVNPLPDPNIIGNLGICPGSSTTLDAGSGFSSYEWSTGETTQTISVNTAGAFIVTVTNANECAGSDNEMTFLATPPSPTDFGDTGFCPGETADLDAGDGYSSYNWSTGESSQAINVNTPGIYSVTVIDNNGCSGSGSQTVEAFSPPTAPIISGELTFCDGNNTILSVGANLISYIWSTGEMTNAIVVDTLGTFSVTVTDINGCSGADQVTTTLDGALPDIPGPISGTSMGLCGAAGLTYSIAPVPNTTHYVWTVPNGMSITSGQGSTSINVDAIPNFNSGIIVAKASNACGQSPTFNQSFLLVQGYPDIPGTPQGSTSGVCNFFTNIYTIDPVGGADSYNWTVPAGASILYGQGTTTIAVNFNNFSGSGDICVDAINACGVSLCCFGNCLTVTCTTEPEDLSEPKQVEGEMATDELYKLKVNNESFEGLGIYPNPNKGQFRLEGDIPEEVTFEIMVYSLLGELVYFENKGNRTKRHVKEAISLPGLSDGTYIVKVKVGQTTWNSKVIIMR